jgi:hypothetical protein
MSFLAPLFFLGALGVGLPIIFHLIRRTTRERNVFSSLMFLSPSPPRLVKRNRFEHLLLLLLRCAVICLFAVGFSRPFLKKPMAQVPDSTARRILLLVDDSASMRRANLWADALEKAKSVVREATPSDQVALYLFDQQLRPLFTFDQWNSSPLGDRASLLLRQLTDAKPGWGSTHLGAALIQSAEILTDSAGKAPLEHGQIELITDLQEGSRIEQLEGYEWPKGVQVAIEVLKPRTSNNASVQLIPDAEDSTSKTFANVRVRVANAGGSKQEQFKVGWGTTGDSGFVGKPIETYVPAGQNRVVVLPVDQSAAAPSCIRLKGDDEEFDNLVFVTPPQSLRLSVTYVGNDTETDSRQALYFLKRAFQETRHQTVQIRAHQSGELVSADEAKASPLFVITSPLPDGMADGMRAQAAAGKTILVAGVTPDLQSTLRRLLAAENLRCEEVRPANYALLGEMDFRHPIFAAFADPRFSDFTRIHFWKYVRLDPSLVPSARVIAKFDSGDPALLEVPVGTGKVLVLTTGWQPGFSQLALSSKFVPILYSILEDSGTPDAPTAQYRVGDMVPLGSAQDLGSANITVVQPDGSQVNVPDNVTNFTRTELPGVYAISSAGNTKRFVVNLDPAESRIAPLPTDELERLGVPVFRSLETRTAEAVRKARLQNAELENRQKLWRWFIISTLVILLLESWLAGRTARRSAQSPGAIPGTASIYGA